MPRFYNTPRKTVEEFTPLKAGGVTLYTCGPTVYHYQHIGNLSAGIYWDTLVRMLQASHYDVKRVMNITDVGHLVSDADEGEDKMEKGARREGKSAWDVADYYTKDFLQSMDKLNWVRPTHITKATDHIDEQIALIKRLEAQNHTYTIDDGVYFDTATFAQYTDFAHIDSETLKAGARVEHNTQKRHPSDFALWKFSPKNSQRDMEWDSPWGKGFPGWHIECSAMAMKYLGDTTDIHTGGIEHIPVHHTNEIAQSQAATGKPFARFWLHNNHLLVDGRKMAKSDGNVVLLNDIVARGFDPLDFRMFVLQSHYRTQSNFTWQNLTGAQNRRKNWQNSAALRHQTIDTTYTDEAASTDEPTVAILQATQALKDTLQDDLSTPHALTIIEEAFTAIASSEGLQTEQLTAFNALLGAIDDLLGLDLLNSTPDITADQKELIAQRQSARAANDWAQSDKLRDDLMSQGIAVRDTANGPIWERV